MHSTFRTTVALLASLSVITCSDDKGTNLDDDTDEDPPVVEAPDLPGPPAPPAQPYGTIAYASGNELRLIEPDGSGDKLVWAAPPVPGQPTLSYTVTGVVWRRDGGEIGFGSDHEEALSPYKRDVYAIKGDGSNFRKITNAPSGEWLDDYPTGTVTVNVTVGAIGPFFVIVQGAPEPKMISAGGRLTFTDVADLGDVAQAVVATNGADRWIGTAVDVRAGTTADAGLLSITQFSGIPGYGADAPFWRADGSRIAFLGPLCTPQVLPADPPVGFSVTALVDETAFAGMCAADYGPTPATADELLFATVGFDDDGNSFIYHATEGSTQLPAPLLTFDRYTRITDVRWLPDGSGFIVAKQDDLLDEDVNLHEYKFATGQLTRLTDFSFGGEFVRGFSLSPDGQQIVFERTDDLVFAGSSDIWIANRDGSGARLLVADARYPAWNPVP
jgi:TolB protein